MKSKCQLRSSDPPTAINTLFCTYDVIVLSIVFNAYMHHVLLIGCDTAKVAAYIWECLVCGFFSPFLSHILADVHYIQRRLVRDCFCFVLFL